MAAVGDRIQTMVASFDVHSPRTSAYSIHVWVTQRLGLTEDDLLAMQVDGVRRKVYLKFVSDQKLYAMLQSTQGKVDFHHESGEVSTVTLDVAGMGVRKVRIANLSPEAPDTAVRVIMSRFGDVRSVSEEKWPRSYPLRIPNGIRVVELLMRKHIPSSLLILGQRVLVSYDGQPVTCFGCNEEGHLLGQCPYRRSRAPRVTVDGAATWADTVRHGSVENQLPVDRCEPLLVGESGGLASGLDAGDAPAEQREAVEQVSPCLVATGDETLRIGELQEGVGQNSDGDVTGVVASGGEPLPEPRPGDDGGGEMPVEPPGRTRWADEVEEGRAAVLERCAGFMGGGPDCAMEIGVVDGAEVGVMNPGMILIEPREGTLPHAKRGGDDEAAQCDENGVVCMETVEPGEIQSQMSLSGGEVPGGARHSRSVSPAKNKKMKTGKGPTQPGSRTRSRGRQT
jgi:hypothetical protein